MATTLARIEFRRKTAAQWTSSNEVLLASEPGVETDTGKWKFGDGTTTWSSLPYQAPTAASIAATYETLTGGASKYATLSAFGLNIGLYGVKGDGATITDAAITSGQATLTRSGGSFSSSDAGKNVLIVGAGVAGAYLATTISSVSGGVATLAVNASTSVSGATAHYATDDSTALSAYFTAANTVKRRAYLPKPAGSFYGVAAGISAQSLAGAHFRGDGDRVSIIKAVGAPTRMIDMRESMNTHFAPDESIGLDGSNAAACLLDMGTTTVGASTGNRVKARLLAATDRGLDFTNNGDAVVGGSAGPFPSTATVCYWPDPAGNVIVENARWLPENTSTTGPARASLETSAQNIDIRGGVLQGIKILDTTTCWNLSLWSVQLYPIKDGPNVLGPTTSGSIQTLVAVGGKMSALTATNSILGGRYKDAIVLQGVQLNSSATSTPNGFDTTFATPTGAVLRITGCELAINGSGVAFTWNDTQTGLELEYRKFYGYASPDLMPNVIAGSGAAGTGILIGGGTRLRLHVSATKSWTPGTIAANATVSTNITVTGAAAGMPAGHATGIALGLPAGIIPWAQVTGSNQVTAYLTNTTAAGVAINSGAAITSRVSVDGY